MTIPIDILGSDSLELLGRGSQCLGKKKEENMNTRACAVPFSQKTLNVNQATVIRTTITHVTFPHGGVRPLRP